MWNGLPTDMPAGVVDLDNTATTRNIIRNLDAFQQTKIVAHYAGFADARKAMQEGKIYAFYFIQSSAQGFFLYQLFLSGSRVTAL